MNKVWKGLFIFAFTIIMLALIACGGFLGYTLITYLFELLGPHTATIKMFAVPILVIIGLLLLLGLIPLAINWCSFLGLLIWQKLNKEKPKTELPVFDKRTPPPPVSAPQGTPYPTATPVAQPTGEIQHVEKVTPAFGAHKVTVTLEKPQPVAEELNQEIVTIVEERELPDE